MSDTDIKQVIVMRRDLHMRRGKEIAQGAHAAMGWLRNKALGNLTADETAWFYGEQRTITLQVPDQATMAQLVYKASLAGLPVHVVVDKGYTEFKGQETATCIAIGPAKSDAIDKVTVGYQLY